MSVRNLDADRPARTPSPFTIGNLIQLPIPVTVNLLPDTAYSVSALRAFTPDYYNPG